MQKIIVVGAGIAGLMAATTLAQKGHQVIVIDKGRGVGGRMSSKSVGQARFDYGAQFFSAKTNEFQKFIQAYTQQELIQTWELDWLVYPRYIGVGGMSNIPKNIAKNLDLKMGQKVISIKNQGQQAIVSTDQGHEYKADALVLTCPVPQALALLEHSQIVLSNTANNILQGIDYEPCIALMLNLNASIKISKSGGLLLQNPSIAWLADNQAKGISSSPSLTVHTTAAFARLHFDEPLPQTTELILNELTSIVPQEAIIEAKIHRWRYSLASVRHQGNFYKATLEFPLYFAGDAFGMGNVEGAFLSGLAVGNAI